MNEINEKDDSLIYEVGFHLLPTVDEADVPLQSSNIRSIIEENGGGVIAEDMPKMLSLSYDISKSVDSKKQKFNKAYFGSIKFEVEPEKVLLIKNKIENLQNVLRFLIVKTVKENTMHTPKNPMFKKESIKEEKTVEHIEKPKVSEAEIDKSIDNLVIDQTL